MQVKLALIVLYMAKYTFERRIIIKMNEKNPAFNNFHTHTEPALHLDYILLSLRMKLLDLV